MKTHRRMVAGIAAPAVRAARAVYGSACSDTVRVAVLVEIAAAAAVMARTIVRLRRLDPDLIAPHVTDPVDLRAVLGVGRWLPGMTRHVPDPPNPIPLPLPVVAVSSPGAVRRAAGRPVAAGQQALFPAGDQMRGGG